MGCMPRICPRTGDFEVAESKKGQANHLGHAACVLQEEFAVRRLHGSDEKQLDRSYGPGYRSHGFNYLVYLTFKTFPFLVIGVEELSCITDLGFVETHTEERVRYCTVVSKMKGLEYLEASSMRRVRVLNYSADHDNL